MARVLACGEFTQISSGYGVYMNELLKRLSATPGIEVAELASYCSPEDPRINNANWKVYPVAPHKDDSRSLDIYNSNPLNPFGKGIFNDVLVSFKPTHVIDIRDSWHIQHEFNNPLRDFYAHVVMPAVDAEPQHKTWIDMYASADKILSYTDWGIEVLKKQGLKNTFKSASPCAGYHYKPVSPETKKQLKASLGLGNIKIVGTVMRNQRRKLFPDLFQDFAKFLSVSKHDDIFLLCHTSYPDTWDMSDLILKHGIGNRVLFTYKCMKCNTVEVGFFKGMFAHCNKCKENTLMFPSTKNNIDEETLAQIFNLMDLYVQYSVCEGYGIPLAEAIACSIPVMAVDYSAMSEIIHQSCGETIKVAKRFVEPETFREMALPDSDDFINKLKSFFELTEDEQRQKGEFSRILYGLRSYDDVAKVWIDAIKQTSPKRSWDEPKRNFSIPQVPNGLTNSEFARFLIVNVLQRPELANSYLEARLIRDLNSGFYIRGFDGKYYHEDMSGVGQAIFPFDRELAFKHFASLLEDRMIWENRR